MPPLDPRALGLPAKFVAHNSRVHAEWLAALPEQLARLAERWSLAIGAPFPNAELNYVAPAVRETADGAFPCVLKVSGYLEGTSNEIAALLLWDGHGASRLLESAPDEGALLIERLHPGTMLVEVAEEDDDAATLIAAETLGRLWRTIDGPGTRGLRVLESWCDAYDRNRAALEQGDGGFPAALFRRADAMRCDLLASTAEQTVLHGDMHHYNVLRAGRAPWLAIDPKGLLGDRHFDVCQFMRNPQDRTTPRMNGRRLDIFSAELGLDRQRAKNWCFVHAVLDACWDYEDGNSWRRAVAFAEATLTF